jgi:hypothetical protein
MNERVKILWAKAAESNFGDSWEEQTAFMSKFAELIVAECKENFSKVWYEQGMDIRGAEIGKFLTRFEEHFGVEE